MSRPALGRIAAGATLTTLAVATGVGTAAATTPAHTSLSIRSVSSTISPGGHDVIRGELRSNGDAVRGVQVVLDGRKAGASSFSAVAAATTGGHGQVAFTVTPATRTAYKLVFAGSPAWARSHSGIVTVSIRRDGRIPTSLSIRSTHSAVNPGGKDVVRGVLLARRSPLRDRLVVLKRKRAGATSWQELAAARTGRHGAVAFTVTPNVRTHYLLVFRGNRSLRPTRSGIVTVNVRTPVTLSSALASSTIEPGGSDTVSGVLSTATGPVAGRSASTAPGEAATPTPTPTATTSAAPVPASLALSPARSRVPFGQRATAHGTLTTSDGSPVPDHRVVLLQRAAGSSQWSQVAHGRTRAGGTIALRSPRLSRNVRLRLSAGQGVHSDAVSIVVLPHVAVHYAVTSDDKHYVVTVSVSGAQVSDVVALAHRENGSWNTLRRKQLGDSMTLSFTLPAPKTNTAHYRIRVPATDLHGQRDAFFSLPPPP